MRQSPFAWLSWLAVLVVGLTACQFSTPNGPGAQGQVATGSLTIAGTTMKAAVVQAGAQRSVSQLLRSGQDGSAANDVVVVNFAGGKPVLATQAEIYALDVLFVKNNQIVAAYTVPNCAGYATKDIPIYQSSQIPVYQSSPIAVYTAKPVAQVTATPIPVYTAQPVTPDVAAPLPAARAQPVTRVAACTNLQPAEADVALVFDAGTIEAKGYKIGTPISLQLGGSGATPPSGQIDPKIVGKWAIDIPTMVWPVDKQIFRVDGASLGLVTIKADGSYVWHKKWGDFPGTLQPYTPQRPPAQGKTYFKLNDGKYDFYFTGDLTTLFSPAGDLYAASGAYLGE